MLAAGNCLAAVAGSYALERSGFRAAFPRVQDVRVFVLFGALGSALISATNGTTLLYLTDHIQSYGSSWVLWWFGDSAGDLLVAPLIFVLVSHRRRRPSRERLTE
jgi:integral membrane sensor domain MASE1